MKIIKVGVFTKKDIEQGKDKEMTKNVSQATGCPFILTKMSRGRMEIFVCDYEFYIQNNVI